MEFSNLGKHCSKCKQQDYLPFECDYCNKILCKEHRSGSNHKCIHEDTLKNIKKEKKPRCTNCKRKIRYSDRSSCSLCRYKYCKKHITFENHNCVMLMNI